MDFLSYGVSHNLPNWQDQHVLWCTVRLHHSICEQYHPIVQCYWLNRTKDTSWAQAFIPTCSLKLDRSDQLPQTSATMMFLPWWVVEISNNKFFIASIVFIRYFTATMWKLILCWTMKLYAFIIIFELIITCDISPFPPTESSQIQIPLCFKVMILFSLIVIEYIYVYAYVFLNITFLVSIILCVCSFQGGPFGTEPSIGVLSPGEEHLSCSQLPSVAFSLY